MLSVDEWRPVLGWENAYQVSSTGQVRSIDRVVVTSAGVRRSLKGRVLKQKYNMHYMKVTLTRRPAADKTACVHQLVCEAFHGPRPDNHVVRHLNGDYLDNRASNLTWGTRSENGLDMLRHGTSYWASRTHCENGHEYTDQNTRWYARRNGRPFRNCRTCQRKGQRVRARAKVEAR